MEHSISETNGLATLSQSDQTVYSIGISTAGLAEIRMAKASPTRHIIATTIDRPGAAFTQNRVKTAGLLERIEVKLEDVTSPLPYKGEYFDFVYARLSLHYLPKEHLIKALCEIHRVLKRGGKFFVVVRSTDCKEAQDSTSVLNPSTGITTYIYEGLPYKRFFHDRASIQQFLKGAKFHIRSIQTYDEKLCVDFERTNPSKHVHSLIEVLASK